MVTDPQEIDKLLKVPESDSASPVKVSEAQFIFSFLKEKNLKDTLETGFAYARSASHIIAATQSKHIAIDPFQENYQSLGLSNIKALGMHHLLDFHADFSHNVLPALYKEKRTFDFIFIDGDHKFDGELIDFYYADFMLKDKGYVLLHDTWMRSTRLLMRFIEKNRKDYIKVKTPLRNFALYQKIGADSRNGMHFREFYTFKSLVTHNVIMYLTTGKDNFLKRMIFKLKELLK